jgi:ribosomal protein S18 acetylase RimI-like enzyme
MSGHRVDLIPREAEAPQELDFSHATSDDFESLARDRIPVRSMRAGDLDAIVAIDRRLTGRDRRDDLAQMLDEALNHSDVRVSLVAELEGLIVGFVMARVDLGAFGEVAPVGVLDTVGVDPGFSGRGVGRALVSQLALNLGALRVERMRSVIAWNDAALIGFVDAMGFAPAPRLALARWI